MKKYGKMERKTNEYVLKKLFNENIRKRIQKQKKKQKNGKHNNGMVILK